MAATMQFNETLQSLSKTYMEDFDFSSTCGDDCHGYNERTDRGSNDSSEDVLERVEYQGRLCWTLLQQLQGVSLSKETPETEKRSADSNSTNKETSTLSLRDILGDQATSIAQMVGPLLQDRVDRCDLLPATQDVVANEEVLRSHKDNTRAMTLTLPSIQAACLYSHLLGFPGALGSGLVDLEWLTALNAVVRRWAIECCGREDLLRPEFTVEATRSSSDKPQHGESHSESPPKKKARQTRQKCSDDGGDIESSSIVQSGSQGHEASPSQVLEIGLQVALALCAIPGHKEFVSWSSEAREVILDVLSVALGTSAALQVNNNDLCLRVISKASNGLKRCLVNCQGKIAIQHETTVVILRGLLHLLQFKEVLPGGERGRLDAHAAAAEILQGLIEEISHASSKTKSSRRRSSLGDTTNLHQQTPSRRRRRSSVDLTTPTSQVGKTPGRRRRASFEGTNVAFTAIQSPALKGRRSSLGTTFIQSPGFDPKPRPVWSAFVGMLQKLATTQGLERASNRSPTTDTLLKCTAVLPLHERTHFLHYLLKLAKSKVSLHRLVACELIGLALVQEWLSTHADDLVLVDATLRESAGFQSVTETPTSIVGHGQVEISLPNALWEILQGRLVDKLAAVRARAAISIEAATSKHSEWLSENLLSRLRQRALSDETATMRKAAASALSKVLLSRSDLISEIDVEVFCELCHDSSLLTRKVAAESLTTLLEKYFDHPTTGTILEQAWSACVLPMVLDEETASKAIGSLDRVVVTPLLWNDVEENVEAVNAAWRLLAQVSSTSGNQGASKGALRALVVGLHQMAQEDSERICSRLVERVIKIVLESLEMDMSEARIAAVWCLLQALLSQKKHCKAMTKAIKKTISLKGVELICATAWKVLLERCLRSQQPSDYSTLRSSFWVISKLADSLDVDSSKRVQKLVEKDLVTLNLPPVVIGASIEALIAISCRMNPPKTQEICKEWIALGYTACEGRIAEYVHSSSTDEGTPSTNHEAMVRALFTVGELSMVGFRADDDNLRSGGQNSRQTVAETCDITRGMHEKPPERLLQLIQTLLSPSLPGNGMKQTPTEIRAHAFTVLGKLCLRDEELAKISLNILARELHPSIADPNPSVQSNALLVLGDLCVRYTNMADRYLPVMASCLQAGAADPESNLLQNNSSKSAIVRKHAVLLLSSLLLQDYIKWRGLLFHRFLVACSDEDEEVAALAESVLSGPLYTRNPKLFFNNFVEALFVLNKCTAHPIYIAAASQGDGGSGIAVGFEGIHLNGELGRVRRRRMYEFLLSKLSDEEKIGITARLAKEVLGGAASCEDSDLARVCREASLPQNSRLLSAWNVLTDAFAILTCKSIRVGKMQEDDNIEDPNIPNPTRQVTVAKNRLLSKISRKHLIEIVLPILCNLKIKLRGNCSPLLKNLMDYLLDIFKAYKNEVKDFLGNDPTLLQELEYDARQFAIQNNSSL